MRAIYLYTYYTPAKEGPIGAETLRSENALDEVWIHLIERLTRDVDSRREKKRLAEEAAEKKRKSARFVAARVDALRKGPTAFSREEIERYNGVIPLK